MTLEQTMTAIVAALIGFACAQVLTRLWLEAPPRALMRTNVSGKQVPAILGGPLAIGGLIGLGALGFLAALDWDGARTGAMGVAVAFVVVVMSAAGRWDDLRGDERPRGFKGHVTAGRAGVLTGGIVKLIAGGIAGLGAGSMLSSGWVVLEIALLVALTANLVNLFDRAPGRAGKVALAIALVLIVPAPAAWSVAAAGLLGALIACLVYDLAEKAMLGDAGANPLGAVVGLGLATLERPARLVAIGVLLVLNAASEKWSFSRVIESSRWLSALDRLGRLRK